MANREILSETSEIVPIVLTERSSLSVRAEQIVIRGPKNTLAIDEVVARQNLHFGGLNEMEVARLFSSVVEQLLLEGDQKTAHLKKVAAQVTKLLDCTDPGQDPDQIVACLDKNLDLFPEIVSHLSYEAAFKLGCLDCSVCSERRAAMYLRDLFNNYSGQDLSAMQEKVLFTFEERMAGEEDELRVDALALELLRINVLPVLRGALEALVQEQSSEIAESLLHYFESHGYITYAPRDPDDLDMDSVDPERLFD